MLPGVRQRRPGDGDITMVDVGVGVVVEAGSVLVEVGGAVVEEEATVVAGKTRGALARPLFKVSKKRRGGGGVALEQGGAGLPCRACACGGWGWK